MPNYRTFLIEQTVTPGEWMVTEDKGDVSEILFSGSQLDCAAWCHDQGAIVETPSRFVIPETYKWFECPYEYTRHEGVEGILSHFREKHPRQVHLIDGLSPGLLRSRLSYIDRSYNGPATD